MQCRNCGIELVAGAAYCSSCGKPVLELKAASDTAVALASGMQANVAAALCYLAGFISAAVFLTLEPYRHNPFVRYHAFQAIFLSVAWILLHFALSGLIAIVPWTAWRLIATASSLVSLAAVTASILLIYKAWGHKRFKLPLIGDLAEKWTSDTA